GAGAFRKAVAAGGRAADAWLGAAVALAGAIKALVAAVKALVAAVDDDLHVRGIAAGQAMIDTGQKGAEHQQAQDQGGIGKEFLLVQQLWQEQIGIQVIEGDEETVVDDKIGREVMVFEKGKIDLPGPGEEKQGQQQEAKPGCQMDRDLYGKFLHVALRSYPEIIESTKFLDEWGYWAGEWISIVPARWGSPGI